MKMKKLIFSLLVVVFLSGCASYGNRALESQTPASIRTLIVEGETTKSKIRNFLGDPMNVTLSSEGESWQWILSSAEHDPINFIPFVGLFAMKMEVNVKQLIVLWNDDDTVKKYVMTDSNSSVRSGLLK